LPFDLIADAEEALCNRFGVIRMKTLYGRAVRGIERSTFVIDSRGRIAKEWRGVKVPGHAEEVLAFVETL
jgi:peroxiredoxin Q/BCP